MKLTVFNVTGSSLKHIRKRSAKFNNNSFDSREKLLYSENNNVTPVIIELERSFQCKIFLTNLRLAAQMKPRESIVYLAEPSQSLTKPIPKLPKTTETNANRTFIFFWDLSFDISLSSFLHVLTQVIESFATLSKYRHCSLVVRK